MDLIIIIYLAILGLLCGSFVNAAAWRLRLGSTKKITKGRSVCPKCDHTLASKDLIPVFSWVYLRGKCRYCQKPISAQYPLIELLTGVLFALSYIFWDKAGDYWHVYLGVWLINTVWLLVLAIIDYRWMQLPYKITFSLFGFNVIAFSALGVFGAVDFLPHIFAAGVFGGMFAFMWFISRGTWVGDGDIPLLANMGLILGPLLTFLALFVGSSIGSVYALTMIALKKRGRDELIPFGPLLIGGTLFAQIFGGKILSLLML